MKYVPHGTFIRSNSCGKLLISYTVKTQNEENEEMNYKPNRSDTH